MAIQEVLATRRTEALDRIDKLIARIAEPHGVKYGELLNIRHNDPDIGGTIRLETLARVLNDVATAQDKASQQARTTQELSSADTLRNAILGATDDDLIALPGYGEKTFADLRDWASKPPEPAASEAAQETPSAADVQAASGATPEPSPNATATGAPIAPTPSGSTGRVVSSDTGSTTTTNTPAPSTGKAKA